MVSIRGLPSSFADGLVSRLNLDSKGLCDARRRPEAKFSRGSVHARRTLDNSDVLCQTWVQEGRYLNVPYWPDACFSSVLQCAVSARVL